MHTTSPTNPTARDARHAAEAATVADAHRILRAARDHCALMTVRLLLSGDTEAALLWAEHVGVADTRIGMLLDPQPANRAPGFLA